MLQPLIAAIFGVAGLWYAIYGATRLGLVLAGGVAAIAMFILRLRCRLVYGLLEFGFGFFVLWDAAGKGRGAFSSGFSDDFQTFHLTVVLAQTLAAIYVLIRGLDNCYQGSAALRSILDRLVGSVG